MTDGNSKKQNRRKLLKSVAAGGGAIIAGKTLPENWVRPAVESVVLPAHAQTSLRRYSGTQMASLESDSLLARATDSLVPRAHATDPDYDVSWCITQLSDTTAEVSFLVTEMACADSLVTGAWLCTATGPVTVGVQADLSCVDACETGGNAGEWFKKLGLVKDALASADATVLLNGVYSGDSFVFTRGSIIINGTLSVGNCGPTSAVCTKDYMCITPE